MQLQAVLSPAAVATVLLLASPVAARTWSIHEDGTGDAPTVQAGIDSAAVGDTVLVGPGTYKEKIDFVGKNLVLKSATGPELTILAGFPDARGSEEQAIQGSLIVWFIT